ncbi:YqcI/YcgG family protein [Labedaea rhizosphaerae]|uniref:MazG-like nucleotide pyrophosphohydrolase family protein n=1 Tax=Labedaea rhizosphaerae TaxID=598644 RepID=A0A4R6S0T8_LABRH|nr:YqcI/YcgG family protein [Labedaea rhizosphaerae]TDP92226.1 MazG-like nucleotide pyrophosphohydrolase family protein [Labedaea rhizosphaerae]
MDSYTYRGLSDQQQRLAATIEQLGGYWPPISAVARLLEEFGELAEVLLAESERHEALSEEMADLWIIAACLANQFCIPLPVARAATVETDDQNAPVADQMQSLLVHAGQIARVVNYYDGSKPPRNTQDWLPLTKALRHFHVRLSQLAAALKVDLESVVDDKLTASERRDRGRFEHSFDPSTAQSLTEFEVISGSTPCVFAPTARLWGAPPWRSDLSMVDNVAAFLPYLTRFAKAARLEGLDTFVVSLGLESPRTMRELAARLREVLHALVQLDPTVNRSFRGPVAQVGWQFSFGGVRMFVSVFSHLYEPTSPRYSPDATFLTFQPETSFDHCSIGSAYAQSDTTKQRIRDEFRRKGLDYPMELIDDRVEARLYLLPRFAGDTTCEWWHVR